MAADSEVSVCSFLPSRPIVFTPVLPARGRLPAHCFSCSLPTARLGGVRDHGLHHRLRVGEVRAAVGLGPALLLAAPAPPYLPSPAGFRTALGAIRVPSNSVALFLLSAELKQAVTEGAVVQCSDEAIFGRCGCGRADSARLQCIRGSRPAVCEPGGRSGLAEDYSEHP